MIIHVPNKNIIVPKDPLSIHAEIAGFYKIEKLSVDPYGNAIEASREVVADWFPNIITDQGLNRIGTNQWNTACQVGSGTATPLVTDTGLQTFVAGTTGLQSAVSSAQGSSPYYGADTRRYRFAVGVAAGNLSEVGIGWLPTGSNLFSRARILDGGGNPTTITVLSTEVLDVTYEIRNFVPAADVTGNFTVTGVGNIGFTVRGAAATSTGWAPLSVPSMVFNTVYAGNIGPVTGYPSGVQSTITHGTSPAYANNSLQRVFNYPFDLNEGNVTGGIRSFLTQSGSSNWGLFQFELGTIIPKTYAQTLTLSVQNSWARR